MATKNAKHKLDRMNWLDHLILLSIIRDKKCWIQELRAEMSDFYKIHYNKNISYQYIYQRLDYLCNIGLLVVTNEYKKEFAINSEIYEEITNYVKFRLLLETKIEK